MDSLSEAISQLILFVMAMQESNSVMPDHIPPAAVCISLVYFFFLVCYALLNSLVNENQLTLVNENQLILVNFLITNCEEPMMDCQM
jgi:hypothetical protein